MFVYILMIIISLFFSVIAKKVKFKYSDIIFAILSAVPFIIVSAIRYDVGTDYLYRYAYDYQLLQNGYDIKNLEIGFKLLDKLCILITDSYQIIFIITSIIITSLIFITIYRDSKNVPLSIALYFIGAFFFQSLNMVRQYISISIILYSYKYILNRNWLKWILFILLATAYHSTAILFAFIISAIILIRKIFKKDIFSNGIIVATIVGILFFCEPILRECINWLLSITRFEVYIGSKFDYGDLQVIPFIINTLIYIAMIYISKKKDKIEDADRFFINMQAMALIFITLGKTSILSIRLVYYFSIFQIISIPHFIIKVKKIWDNKKYIIAMVMIIFMFSASVTWTHIIHTSDEVLPYKTIFNPTYEFK